MVPRTPSSIKNVRKTCGLGGDSVTRDLPRFPGRYYGDGIGSRRDIRSVAAEFRRDSEYAPGFAVRVTVWEEIEFPFCDFASQNVSFRKWRAARAIRVGFEKFLRGATSNVIPNVLPYYKFFAIFRPAQRRRGAQSRKWRADARFSIGTKTFRKRALKQTCRTRSRRKHVKSDKFYEKKGCH